MTQTGANEPSPTRQQQFFDLVTLRDFTCEAIIGLLPEERITPQPLKIEIELHLDLENAGLTGDLTHSVDYAQVLTAIIFILEKSRFLLLESAALAISRFILDYYPQVNYVTARLAKPEILRKIAVPEVKVTRHRVKTKEHNRTNPFFSCPEVRLEIITLSPDQKDQAQGHHYVLPLDPSRQLRVTCLIG